MPDVTVVGSANIDFSVLVERLPGPGETVLGDDLRISHGGKGANQALAASRAGAAAAFIAKVGRDAQGDEMRRHLLASGLSLDAILEDLKAPTGVALILVEPGGRNQIAVASGSNMRLTREDLEPHLFLLQGTRVLLVQLEILTETVVYAIREARKADVTTILNPAPARPLPPDVYPLVECITPNQAEATALSGIRVTGIPSARAAAAWFRDRGCQTVIITLAAAGAVLATQEGAWHIPAFSVYAVDSTAAGDAFNGVLATGLAQDKSPEEAVRWASAAAALTCTRRGAQESLPDLAAIEAFLATHPAPAPIALS